MASQYDIARLRESLARVQPQVSWSDHELAEMLATGAPPEEAIVAQSDDPYDQFLADAKIEIARGVRAAAEDFAALLRQRIPRRKEGVSRETAQHVAVYGSDPLHLVVQVPFPWQFNEFGTVNQKPNPIVRRTLAENLEKYKAMMSGQNG